MERPKRRSRLWWVGLAAVALTFSLVSIEESDEPFPRITPDPRYDALYSTYVELCAVSQIRASFTEHGGSPGHAAMFLKGACRSSETPYPTLERCAEPRDPADTELGTGISVNKILRNVNWIATPGKQLFFYGNLGPDDVLDEEHALRTVRDAHTRGVFAGVEVGERYLPPESDADTKLYLAAAKVLGTDFALSFGRSTFCARLPMPRREFEHVLDYLNSLNREYATGEADYEWSGYNDNCAHTVHNALAAAGVWRHKSIRSFKLGQLANLSVPANEFADLALRTMQLPIDDFDAIYADPVLRKTLIERGWLPGGHGAIVTHIPVHPHNEIYDSRMRIFMLENPFRRRKSHRVMDLYRDPRNTDVEANLTYFKGVYERILSERSADDRKWRAGGARAEARAAYYGYIAAQRADANQKLAILRSITH